MGIYDVIAQLTRIIEPLDASFTLEVCIFEVLAFDVVNEQMLRVCFMLAKVTVDSLLALQGFKMIRHITKKSSAVIAELLAAF